MAIRSFAWVVDLSSLAMPDLRWMRGRHLLVALYSTWAVDLSFSLVA